MNIKTNNFHPVWETMFEQIFEYVCSDPQESIKQSHVCQLFRKIILEHKLPGQLSDYNNSRAFSSTKNIINFAGLCGPYLQSLDLRYRPIQSDQIDSLASNCKSLKKLIISNVGSFIKKEEFKNAQQKILNTISSLSVLTLLDDYETAELLLTRQDSDIEIITNDFVQESKKCMTNKVPIYTQELIHKTVRISSLEELRKEAKKDPGEIQNLAFYSGTYLESFTDIICEAKRFKNLRRLHYDDNNYTFLAEFFKKSNHEIEHIGFAYRDDTFDQWEEFFNKEYCKKITSILIFGCYNFDENALDKINNYFPNLKILSLSGEFDSSICKSLKTIEFLPKLEQFSFEHGPFWNNYNDMATEMLPQRISSESICKTNEIEMARQKLRLIEEVSVARPELFLNIRINCSFDGELLYSVCGNYADIKDSYAEYKRKNSLTSPLILKKTKD